MENKMLAPRQSTKYWVEVGDEIELEKCMQTILNDNLIESFIDFEDP